MKTKHSGAKYSAIVKIGEILNKLEEHSGENYLRLNRGVPAVTNIDLSEVIPLIDFNSKELQVYPPNSGLLILRKAINQYYFQNKTTEDNIFVTAGGMNALDLVFKTLNTSKVLIPEFYWGAYTNIMKINKVNNSTYSSFDFLIKNKEELSGNTVIICDPNNPIGNKYDDKMLLEVVAELYKNNITIIWDSPYRKLFYEDDDTFYSELIKFDNVIIVDSFSKSMGLSGQRLGYIHSTNQEFNEELNINILYATNGINAFAQLLVYNILNSKEGQKAGKDFRRKTIEDMNLNIEYLKTKGLLAEEFYKDSYPVGIFAVVNMSEEELLKHKIGSVGLYYFNKSNIEYSKKYSRICISVPHKELKGYFDKI
jgi:aspartate/methionine/tyrosine aminotransferase